MAKYRKKPIVIDAILWTGLEIDLPKILEFLADGHDDFSHLPGDGIHVGSGIGHVPAIGELTIPTLEGPLTASPGDWIIKGVEGEFYPCKPSIFEATYEPVIENEEPALD